MRWEKNGKKTVSTMDDNTYTAGTWQTCLKWPTVLVPVFVPHANYHSSRSRGKCRRRGGGVCSLCFLRFTVGAGVNLLAFPTPSWAVGIYLRRAPSHPAHGPQYPDYEVYEEQRRAPLFYDTTPINSGLPRPRHDMPVSSSCTALHFLRFKV